MKLTENTLGTWKEFLTVFGHRQRGILFRGQSKAMWPLIFSETFPILMICTA